MKTVHAHYVPEHWSDACHCEIPGAWVFVTPNGFQQRAETRAEAVSLGRDEFNLRIKFDGDGPN